MAPARPRTRAALRGALLAPHFPGHARDAPFGGEGLHGQRGLAPVRDDAIFRIRRRTRKLNTACDRIERGLASTCLPKGALETHHSSKKAAGIIHMGRLSHPAPFSLIQSTKDEPDCALPNPALKNIVLFKWRDAGIEEKVEVRVKVGVIAIGLRAQPL